MKPSSGTAFHSLQATSQALQPMHTEVSVKKPLRFGRVGPAGVRRRVERPVERVAHARHRPVLVDVAGLERDARPAPVLVDPLAAAPDRVGRRPGVMSQLPTLLSWMCTLGSSASPTRSFAESPD